MSKRGSPATFTAPVHISSAGPQQLSIVNGDSSFAINVSQGIAGFYSSGQLAFAPPTQFNALASFSGSHIRQLALARTISTCAGCIGFVPILARNIGGIVRISESAGLADGFEIRLPTGNDIASYIHITNGINVAVNDTLDLTIINETSKTSKFVLTSVDDSMSPLDISGDILVAARSQILISCVFTFVQGTPPVSTRALYVVGRFGGSSTGSSGMAIFPNVASFPLVGDGMTLYIAADTNKTYRFQSGTRPVGYDWVIGTGGDFPNLQTALASASVLNGHKLFVLDGLYAVASTITVAKEVQIYGQSRGGVIFESYGTASDPVTLFSVSANNVVFRGFTIRHQKTTNTSLETALSVAAAGPSNVTSFIIDDCTLEFMEFGIMVRGDAWKISNCAISYIGPNNSTRRAITVYGINGNCFINGNTFINNASTGNLRSIFLSMATVPSSFIGNLAIIDNANVGPMQVFFIQEDFSGVPGGFNVQLKRNVVSPTSAFVSFYAGIINSGDILGEVTAEENHITNVSGKCIFTLEGSVPPLGSFRTTPLPVHARANILDNEIVTLPYVLAPGASDYSCAYDSSVLLPTAVTQDAIIPPTPAIPPTPTIWSIVNGYWELSQMLPFRIMSIVVLSIDNMSYVDLNWTAFPSSTIVFKGRLALNNGLDYIVSTVADHSRLTWIGTIAPGGSEQLVSGDRITVMCVQNS